MVFLESSHDILSHILLLGKEIVKPFNFGKWNLGRGVAVAIVAIQ